MGDGDNSVYLPGDFRYFMSTPVSSQDNADRSEDQGDEREFSSPFAQTQILSQFSPDPSLRINNGPPPIRLGGDVNGEQGVPNNGGIFHPSSGEYRFEGESRGAKAEEDIPDYPGGTLHRASQDKVGSPEAVGREMAEAKAIFGDSVREYMFDDDTFTIDKQRAIAISEYLNKF
jgi:hypothetical protein